MYLGDFIMSERTYTQATYDYILYIAVFVAIIIGSFVVGVGQGYEKGFEKGIMECQEDK